MEHEKKLAFIHKMSKMGLDHIAHMDGGGVISAGNSNPLEGITGALTPQNSFTATGPDAASVVQNQNQLAGVLSSEANGAGPNPAQMQLQKNGQNIAQEQATLNAQNRAINPGLAARMSGNEAVQAQGNAASAAGIQQAQQQLAAQGQLNQLYAQQQNAAGSAQGINAQVSQNNTNAVANTQGGLLKSIPLIGSLFGARGGMVPHMAKGGSIQVAGVPNFSNANSLPDNSSKSPGPSSGPIPSDPFSGMSDLSGSSDLAMPELGDSAGFGSGAAAAPSLLSEAPLAAAALSKGGKVQPMSFAGKWLNSSNKNLMKSGGPVKAAPNQKAVVKDDSLKNDKVPAMLSEGEVVIPRHIMMHPMAPEKAAAFVRAQLAKKHKGLSR